MFSAILIPAFLVVAFFFLQPVLSPNLWHKFHSRTFAPPVPPFVFLPNSRAQRADDGVLFLPWQTGARDGRLLWHRAGCLPLAQVAATHMALTCLGERHLPQPFNRDKRYSAPKNLALKTLRGFLIEWCVSHL